MNKTIKDELMDKIALGTLTNKDSILLDEIRDADPSFDNEVLIRKRIAKSMEYLGDKDIRTLLDSIHENEIVKKRKGKLKTILGIGGLILLSLAIYQIFFTNFTKSQETPRELYASYYQPYVPSVATRGESTELLVESFMKAYLKRDYTKAIDIISPAVSEQNSKIKLCIANATMSTGDTKLSHKLYDEIIDAKDYYYLDHAIWYKALLYIKEDVELDKARDLLGLLASDKEADHHKQALEMLTKL